MPKQGKVWGMTEELFNNGSASVNILHIRKGGFCSEHQHSQKTNLFYIVSGELEIYTWPGSSEGESPDKTTLRTGEATTIGTGVWHKFHALVDTVCLEIYNVKLSADITRRTIGGRN